MYSYLRQINKEFASRTIEKNTKKTHGGSVEFSAISITSSKETEEKREYRTDVFSDYDVFEKDLKSLEGTEYFDFVLNSDYDIKTVPPMAIVRLNGRFEIPGQFDMYSIAQKFMPLITSQIQTENDDEKKIMESFFGNASADIPILIDDEIMISGRLNTISLKEEYTQLEEYNEQDVYILCKVIGIIDKNQVEIFNPLKDFIKLPRTVRRMKDFSIEGLENIVVEGPVLKAEIISIYK